VNFLRASGKHVAVGVGRKGLGLLDGFAEDMELGNGSLDAKVLLNPHIFATLPLNSCRACPHFTSHQ
jgi:hypothetical protein